MEQSESRGVKLKEEIITFREAMGNVHLQKNILDGGKQEAGM